MRTRTVLTIALVLMTHAGQHVFAQTESEPAKATKVDEFGDIQYSDKIARLDNFAIQLQNSPSARGFIIVYRSRRDLPGLSSRLLSQMRDYLVYTRGIKSAQLVLVDGGAASYLSQELWIVQPGAAPIPRNDTYTHPFFDPDSAWKFDEYALGGYHDMEYYYEGDSLDAFADTLRKQPRAFGYVIYYPQYSVQRWEEFNDKGKLVKVGRRVYLDSSRTASKKILSIRAELVNTHKIAATRLKVVDGGYRKVRHIELWILPRGEHPPIPTPNAFPRRMRRPRK